MAAAPPKPPASIKLTYFNIQGVAEVPRLVLKLGNIPFEDIRVNREEMMALKSEGKLPSGQLPIMEVDGKHLSQSMAISTYCAKMAGLYPEDPWEAAKVDAIVQLVVEDVKNRVIYPTFWEKDAEKKAAMRKEAAEKKLPEKFAILESMLSPSGFFVGNSLTIADLNVYVLLNWIGMEVLDGIPKECVLSFPGLTKLCKVINAIPVVSEHNRIVNNGKIPWF